MTEDLLTRAFESLTARDEMAIRTLFGCDCEDLGADGFAVLGMALLIRGLNRGYPPRPRHGQATA